jgi:hypothetical protein
MTLHENLEIGVKAFALSIALLVLFATPAYSQDDTPVAPSPAPFSAGIGLDLNNNSRDGTAIGGAAQIDSLLNAPFAAGARLDIPHKEPSE